MKYSEVRATLASIGDEVGHYHQETESQNAPPALRGHITDGFCGGAALDWLRKVLHGGNAGQGPDVVTAGIAFMGQRASSRDAFYASLNERIKDAKAASLRDVNQKITAMNNRVQDVLDLKVKQLADQKMAACLPGITQREMDDIVDQVQAAVERNRRKLQDEHDQKFANMSTDAKYQAFWRQFGRTMDEKLATRFGEHRYSNLTILRGAPDRQYGPPNGVKDLIVKVVSEPSFVPNTGVLLGVSPGAGTAAGHAIGIHHLNTGDYHLFDPNFGTYKLDYFKLLKAFCWLFMKGYPSVEDGTKDNKDYEIGGKVMGEYVIYGRKQS